MGMLMITGNKYELVALFCIAFFGISFTNELLLDAPEQLFQESEFVAIVQISNYNQYKDSLFLVEYQVKELLKKEAPDTSSYIILFFIKKRFKDIKTSQEYLVLANKQPEGFQITRFLNPRYWYVKNDSMFFNDTLLMRDATEVDH